MNRLQELRNELSEYILHELCNIASRMMLNNVDYVEVTENSWLELNEDYPTMNILLYYCNQPVNWLPSERKTAVIHHMMEEGFCTIEDSSYREFYGEHYAEISFNDLVEISENYENIHRQLQQAETENEHRIRTIINKMKRAHGA